MSPYVRLASIVSPSILCAWCQNRNHNRNNHLHSTLGNVTSAFAAPTHSAQWKSGTGKGAPTKSFFRLDIDIQRNEPNIYKEQQLHNPEGWHGAEVSVTIAGNWQYYRAKVLRYLRQIAVITPYAEVRSFLLVYKATRREP